MEGKLRSALEEAITGLEWGQENKPECFDKADGYKIVEWQELLDEYPGHIKKEITPSVIAHYIRSNFTECGQFPFYYHFLEYLNEDPYQAESRQIKLLHYRDVFVEED